MSVCSSSIADSDWSYTGIGGAWPLCWRLVLVAV